MESNHRFLGVDQASLQLDHGAAFPEVESPGVAPGSSACDADVFLLDHDPKAEAVGVEPTSSKCAAACFPSRVLSRSDGVHHYRRAEVVGLDPTSGCWPPPVFKTGSSSGRMTSVVVYRKLRRLESNQHEDVQSVSSYH